MDKCKRIWINQAELQEMFGISIRFQNKLIMKKKIPHSKIDDIVVYNIEKINQWITDAEVSV